MSDRLEELRAAIQEWSPTLELLQWAVAEIERLREREELLKRMHGYGDLSKWLDRIRAAKDA